MFVVTSKHSSLRQQSASGGQSIRQDVNKYLMTSKIRQNVKQFIIMTQTVFIMTSKVLHGVKKFVIMSKICHDVTTFVRTSKRPSLRPKKCVMTSKHSSGRQKVCRDVKTFVITAIKCVRTSKHSPERQKVRHEIKNI